MHVHSAIPFNIPSYPAAKPTSDTTQSAPLYATTAVVMAYGYSSDTDRNQQNNQSTVTAQIAAPREVSDDTEQLSAPSQAIGPQYNSNASLAQSTVQLGTLIDAFV